MKHPDLASRLKVRLLKMPAGCWSASTLGQINTSTIVRNSGQVLISSGSRLVINSNYSQSRGTTEVDDATLAVTGKYLQSGGVTRLQGSTLESLSSMEIQSGLLEGWGTIDGSLINAGAIDIGDEKGVGRLTVTGDLEQTSTAEIRARIAGRHPSILYDQIVVAGTASLAGRLNVELDFDAIVGEGFDILTYAPSDAGQFAEVYGESRMSHEVLSDRVRMIFGIDRFEINDSCDIPSDLGVGSATLPFLSIHEPQERRLVLLDCVVRWPLNGHRGDFPRRSGFGYPAIRR